MTYVTEDLLTEILLRLPVKCLLKCLCVCKGWYSLIKSPLFVHLHLNHPSNHIETGDYIICATSSIWLEDALSYFSLDNNNAALLPMPIIPGFSHLVDNLMICGPCNGIFCIVVEYFYASAKEEAIFLCNPATRESRLLPNRALGDPCTRACGLGFDPRTSEYKVVSVLRDRILVYTLTSNSWREVSKSTMLMPDGCGSGGLLFNGRLYWNLWDGDILWFDVANEVTGHVPLPPFNDVPEDMCVERKDVVVLEDCLALVVVAIPDDVDERDMDGESCLIIIWKRINESWMEKFSISIPFQGYELHPIYCCKNDVLLLIDIDDLISISLVKEDGHHRVTSEKLNDDTYGAIIMTKESLVSFR